MLRLSINQDWDTRKVDFSNAFVWDTLVEDVYLALPYYFYSFTGEERAKMVTKINNSLYGLVQAYVYWYNHLRVAFEARSFKPSPLDTCMFYGRGIISFIYVDDVLLFVTNQDKIDEVIKELEDAGLSWNVEEDLYGFLVVEVKTDKQSENGTLNQ